MDGGCPSHEGAKEKKPTQAPAMDETREPKQLTCAENYSSVGAGDTFIAGMLYGLTTGSCEDAPWDAHRCVRFAVDLATLKVQREGFAGLGDDILRSSTRQPVTRA